MCEHKSYPAICVRTDNQDMLEMVKGKVVAALSELTTLTHSCK